MGAALVIAADVTRALNEQLHCPHCNLRAGWMRLRASHATRNSVVHRLRCKRCGETIVAKVPRSPGALGTRADASLREYRALCQLQARFPQDSRYGTLVPVANLDVMGVGVLVTRAFAGTNLAQRLSRLDADGVQDACVAAGQILRRLHDSGSGDALATPLDVDEKLADLEQAYGARLLQQPVVRSLWERFRSQAEALRREPIRVAPHHGDFKAENILTDGRRYVLLDTWLAYDSAVVYDMASFLDHARLHARRWRRWAVRPGDALITQAFLSGYGEASDATLRALRWAQVYFMLAYLGRYAIRGRLAAIYARQALSPLLRELAQEL